MKKYQNVGFAATKSQFIDAVSNPAGGVSLIFTNEVKLAPIAGGGKHQMTTGSLTLNTPISIECPGQVGCAPVTVLNESIKIQWNFTKGDGAKLAAYRTELNRALDEAIAKYNLTQGLVPPVQADFAEE